MKNPSDLLRRTRLVLFGAGLLIGLGYAKADQTTYTPPIDCPSGQYYDAFLASCQPGSAENPTHSLPAICFDECLTSSTTFGLVNPMAFRLCTEACPAPGAASLTRQEHFGISQQLIAMQCPSGQYRDMFEGRCKPLHNGVPTSQPQSHCIARCGSTSVMAGRLTMNPVKFVDCAAKCSSGSRSYGTNTLNVISASYGDNCAPGLYGNQTLRVRAQCQNTSGCGFGVLRSEVGDPDPGCEKRYVVWYTCDQMYLKVVDLKKEARGKYVALACP